MKIERTTVGKLSPKARDKFEFYSDGTRVFLAKSGTKTIGTATVSHSNLYADRTLIVDYEGETVKVETALLGAVRTATKYLKRRTEYNNLNF
jgi:hypothetical protein